MIFRPSRAYESPVKQPISVTEFARRLADYLNRVVYRGESFVLLRGRRPIAEVTPTTSGVTLRQLEAVLREAPHLSEREAEDFARDVDAARAALEARPPRDPWER
jgi:hypothetical protein